jgi:hypothetical protein
MRRINGRVIAGFFALSAAFPGCMLLLDLSPTCRFAEYSISASIMILAIAVEAGVNDIYTLQAMFVLMFATMVLGFLADFGVAPVSWIAHGAGWVTFLSAYSPILDAFLQSSARSSPVGAPGFVHVIVFLQFVLFSCFGFVQIYALFCSSKPAREEQQQMLLRADVNMMTDDGAHYSQDDDTEAEFINAAYITLSLVAKTLLGWLILSPTLVSMA